MKAMQYGRQPASECESRTRQQCHALFDASWLGVATTNLGNSGMCAKGGGQN